MSDEDDYLSDKFLAASESSSAKTYSQLRKEALKKSQVKNAQNRRKSRKELERESREAGLGKSLFAPATDQGPSEQDAGNKALSIMMKMGFQPGQALGASESHVRSRVVPDREDVNSVVFPSELPANKDPETDLQKKSHQQRTTPVPLNEWEGRKGIGLGKRARSPGAAERLAKMAKMEESAKQVNFRDRARQAFKEKQAEGRLAAAQQTCATLDEKSGKTFNVLWLNPNDASSFPPGFIDALNSSLDDENIILTGDEEPLPTRLRKQMQADALQPLPSDNDKGDDLKRVTIPEFSTDVLQEAAQFLRLQAQDRLELLLSYLRDQYNYCFWCGTQYSGQDELQGLCPGITEDAHD